MKLEDEKMFITCLDLEGVLVPEIWIAFAEASGIPELKRTTRDEPDYDNLKGARTWLEGDPGNHREDRSDAGGKSVSG